MPRRPAALEQLPPVVGKALVQLGENLALARVRRLREHPSRWTSSEALMPTPARDGPSDRLHLWKLKRASGTKAEQRREHARR